MHTITSTVQNHRCTTAVLCGILYACTWMHTGRGQTPPVTNTTSRTHHPSQTPPVAHTTSRTHHQSQTLPVANTTSHRHHQSQTPPVTNTTSRKHHLSQNHQSQWAMALYDHKSEADAPSWTKYRKAKGTIHGNGLHTVTVAIYFVRPMMICQYNIYKLWCTLAAILQCMH